MAHKSIADKRSCHSFTGTHCSYLKIMTQRKMGMFIVDVHQTIGNLTENEQIQILQMVKINKKTRAEASCLIANFELIAL